MKLQSTTRRRGTMIPMLAVSSVGLFGFLALAIDLGMLTVARTQCQDAADASALAGARELNNLVSNNNYTAAYNMAVSAATSNTMMGQNFVNGGTNGNISSINIGTYLYNTSTQTFTASFPSTLPANTSWSSVQVNMSASQATFFANIFGIQSMPTGASALAVHRPRDIAVVLDFSTSMLFGSGVAWELGYGSSNGVNRGLLNPDSNYPQFGHYGRYTVYNSNFIPAASNTSSATASSVAAASRPHPFYNTQEFVMSDGEVLGVANHTVETNSGPPLVLDFRFNPSNISSPSTPTTATTGMWNAFDRWMQVTPTDTPDTTLPSSQQGNAFAYSSFSPPIASTTVNTSYTARTFNWSGYNPLDTTGTCGPTPAPDFFATQLNDVVNYAGDLWPRQKGYIATTATSWLQSSTNGAAVNCVDLLNWAPGYANPVPSRTATASGSGATLTYAINATPSTPAYASGWTNFRDATFERYGYDLDINDYVTNRPANWDPRWDWNIATSTWMHAYTTAPTVTYRPKLRTSNLYQGYSMGPGYWGKTFYVWPPDPRTPVGTNPGSTGYVAGDWRQRFFNSGSLSSPTAFSTASGADNDPTATGSQSINQCLMQTSSGFTLNGAANGGNRRYSINYNNVLAWLASGPQTMPPNLRAGRICYYSSIPTNVNNYTSNLDQLFWKNYIDFVLGQTADTNYDPQYNGAGVEYNSWPDGSTITAGGTSGFTHGITGATPAVDPAPYMNYADNPNRPRTNFWFGPLTLLHFIYSRSPGHVWSAGTIHEAQSWQLKVAMNSCINDIQYNHPNDCAGLAYFANFNFSTPRAPMSQNWTQMQNALFYPYSLITSSGSSTPLINTITNELRPYNSSFGSALVGNIPNANGGTDPITGMAQAYNLLSSSTSLSTTAYPSLGRRGASKIVIFETDGVPNATPSWSLAGSGYNTYYQNSGSSVYWSGETRNGITLGTSPGGYALPSDACSALKVVDQIVAAQSSSSQGGFSTPNTPARVYGIAFGDLFEGYNGTLSSLSTLRGIDGVNFVQLVQQLGGTSTWSSTATLPTTNVITGSYSTRINNLQTILSQIMQSGVQVTLIQ